ncbi:MAG TPA: hypothetical protein VFZ03_15700 [Dongiaceae bacterium]
MREILMRDWDPIGVAGVEAAADEYDSYAGRVYVMMMDERANAEAIAVYLFESATEYMGLSAGSAELAQRCAKTAGALVALRTDFEAR